MARRLILAPRATTGLREARRWLTQPGAGAIGRRRYEALRSAPDRLLEWTYSGVASVEIPGCRTLVSEGYVILYRVFPDTGDTATVGDVTVLAVFPPGSDRQSLP